MGEFTLPKLGPLNVAYYIFIRTKVMKMPVDTLARKSTTKRKRSSKLRKTRTTATSAKWKVCIPAQWTSCHSLSTSMTNRFPNFYQTMCRPRKVLVVLNKNHSPLIRTFTNPPIARLLNWLLRGKRLFRDIRLWKKN